MSYPRYAEVKASGVEWLGDVPEGWEVTRLKYVSEVAMGQSPPSDQYNLSGDGFPFLQGNAEFTELSPVPKHHCTTAARLSKPDDILLSVRAPVGAMNVSDQVYGIGRGLCAITPMATTAVRFLWHMLSHVRQELMALSTGSTFDTISVEEVRNALFLLPPLPEQQQIAAFLDRKTAELDAVLRLKERQLQLLAEKRQALISQAVTRGLNPTALRKPSGIAWLGDVPEHWEVKRLKYMGHIISGQSPHESTYNTNGIGAVLINGPAEYSESDFGLTVEAKWTSDPIRWAPENCLLFCLRGSTTGRLNITHAEVSIGRGVAAIVAYQDQTFINYLMIVLRAAVVGTSNGSIFPSVTSETLGNYYLTLPPLLEQQAIVAYLDRETTRLDSIAQAIRTQTATVREYRQAPGLRRRHRQDQRAGAVTLPAIAGSCRKGYNQNKGHAGTTH